MMLKLSPKVFRKSPFPSPVISQRAWKNKKNGTESLWCDDCGYWRWSDWSQKHSCKLSRWWLSARRNPADFHNLQNHCKSNKNVLRGEKERFLHNPTGFSAVISSENPAVFTATFSSLSQKLIIITPEIVWFSNTFLMWKWRWRWMLILTIFHIHVMAFSLTKVITILALLLILFDKGSRA